VRCYATDPAAGGANGPPQSRLDFGNRKGRGSEREKEWKGKGEWERSKRGERWGEKENGTKGRKEEGKEKKGKGKGEILCSCDFCVLFSIALANVDTGILMNVGKAQVIGLNITLAAISIGRNSSRFDSRKLTHQQTHHGNFFFKSYY